MVLKSAERAEPSLCGWERIFLPEIVARFGKVANNKSKSNGLLICSCIALRMGSYCSWGSVWRWNFLGHRLEVALYGLSKDTVGLGAGLARSCQINLWKRLNQTAFATSRLSQQEHDARLFQGSLELFQLLGATCKPFMPQFDFF